MKVALTTLFIFFNVSLFAQLKGKIVDTDGQPLPFVNIYTENGSAGTTSNELGLYSLELNATQNSSYTIVFQSLGFTTEKRNVSVNDLPKTINITLTEASVSLDEVVVSTNEDPAYAIIRKAIENRKRNADRIAAFTADFYSRGIWRVKDMPEKILGQEVGDFDGALDSTRTGVIYLSETISEIAYQRPDDFKETILASKVSGDDNGFSFNSARDANFSFYDNTIELNAAIVSPIADNALNYYNYKLEGVFYEGSKLINQITVSPKRPKDRVWEGTIYIVEDDWQLYGVALTTTGQAIQVPIVEELLFKQNFSFDADNDFWVKRSQTIDFGFKFFGVKGDGRFIAVYSDYDFSPEFAEKSFTNEVLTYLENANKKDSLFWQDTRPVPLTVEEVNDYIKKDSIQELRKSEKYLDSVDAVDNRVGLLDILTGYSYQNSYDKWRISYDGPISPDIAFNTVQGWHGNAGLRFFKWYDDSQTRWLNASVEANYGFSDDRLRLKGSLVKNFNRTNRLRLGLYGGTEVRQFNNSEPISPFINTVSTLFFERNYMKLYERDFVQASFFREIINGLRLSVLTGYEKRQPLFNTTDYVTTPKDDVSYTSNNPLLPNDFDTPAIVEHEVWKTSISANITFGQKYMMYPDGKYNLGSEKWPLLFITYENGIGLEDDRFSFSQLRGELYQSITVGNKGELSYHLKGGTFFDADAISFVDYQHFNGNQTRVGTSSNYTNVFNLMPYYQFSTNQSYFEGHLEHDFRGWILGKIPGLNQLNFNLVAGAHFLATEPNKPYSELSIGIDNLGIGKYRLLRLDYVRNFYNGKSEGAIIFGLKFMGILD
ncbi:DUF5686 and carboxypeptidase regulatory-like domain-containing protein [Luteirhabdus pelagi]|uniref:DUF5686 and carboxypeptidase regulatory-like domain-containing protein n=1 Tax=Luteirhabdus pelagi TaxID=2792783 RepID=UPI0019398B9C|nr:DUF5686 and carboxypeptidase regulatory-like domain-containing protein [Luteirhabdus pelagi]